MFQQVDHIGLAVNDMDAALETLKKLGPVVVGELELIERDHLKAVMVKTGEVPIELIQPLGPESSVAKFIEKKGEGLHHIAYRVADVAAALKQCEAEGMRLIDQQPRVGYAECHCGFLHPKSTLGMLTELVQREPGKDQAPYAMPHEK
ncbi:MAG: VOC family protein [Candidatus Sumerlaeia bacterium]